MTRQPWDYEARVRLGVTGAALAIFVLGTASLAYRDAVTVRSDLHHGIVPCCIVRLPNDWCWTIAASKRP